MSQSSSDLPAPTGGEFLFYQTEDGRTQLEVRLENETVWLTQGQMAELFQTTIPNVSMHIRNVFSDGELKPDSVVKESFTTARHLVNQLQQRLRICHRQNQFMTGQSRAR